MSSGSKPVTTIGTRKRSASSGYSPMPITLHTCPAARKACTRQLGDVMIASMAGRYPDMGDQQAEVAGCPASGPDGPSWRWAGRSSRSRCRRTPPRGPGSAGRSSARPAASRRPVRRRPRCGPGTGRRPVPGTRSMSPKEQKITSGREAISRALSMTSSGVTQTGQPGPWINSTSSGRSWSMPCRMMVWVCPPQTSIRAQGRVTVAWMSSSSRRASSGSWNSSMYFTDSSRAPSSATAVPHGPSPPTGRRFPGVAELLLQQAEFVEEFERLPGRLLVQPLQGEARRGRWRTRRPGGRGGTPGTPP